MKTRQENTDEHILAQARLSPSLREKSPRIQRLYDRLSLRMAERQIFWGGDATILTPCTERLPTAARRALAFEKAMREMPIEIEDDDLIAGISLCGGHVVRCLMPKYAKPDEIHDVSLTIFHKTPDYETLLKKGLSGIMEDIRVKISSVEASGSPDRIARLEFLNAMLKETAAVIVLANRFADLADRKSSETQDGARIEDLKKIAEACRMVPEHPAQTMQQAIQSFWLLNFAFFQTQTYISCGRLDLLFSPYFDEDRKNGTLTVAQCQELIDCLFIRFNDRAQINPDTYVGEDGIEGATLHEGSDFSRGFVIAGDDSTYVENNRLHMTTYLDKSDAINHWGQNILIGGLRRNGEDATTAVTYMFLNAFDKMAMTSPVVTARMHALSPEQYVHRVAESVKTGGGMPYINNDDVIISAYERLGVCHEDACGYANSNCWETLLQGMSDQEMIRGVNFLLFLELALNRGRTVIFGGQAGIDTGDPSQFKNFGELMESWKRQLEHNIKLNIETVARIILNDGTHGKLASHPLLSSLMRDCIDNAADIFHGGARYTLWHVLSEAVSNAADALCAIKKLVFEDGKYTMAELLSSLRSDFDGPAGEQLRQIAINELPKFGNDTDEVDLIAAEMVACFNGFVEKYAAKYRPRIIFSPCIATFSWIASIGRELGASLDGRHSMEPIAANMSPVPGSDVSGPTAAINSYLKIDTSHMAAGAPLDLRINSASIDGDGGTARLVGLIKTFLELGGNMITLTITSTDELLSAMKEPEKHRNLRVRMGGWSAYFVMLGDEHQKVHLKRVEHGLA
jgi:formate C-acetyltransferase